MTQRQPGRSLRLIPSRKVRSFLKREDGTVTIFAVIAFAMLIAFIGLVFDVGRVMNMHSQANSYVDRVALAAAAELDGNTDALERALKAAQGDGALAAMIDPGFRLTLSGDDEVGVERLVFMESIQQDDPDPYARSPLPGDVIVATYVAGAWSYTGAHDAESASRAASFVMVESTVETENYILFPIIAGIVPGMAAQSPNIAPQAVAGFEQALCNSPPMAICNPYESGLGGQDFIPDIGQQILLKTKESTGGGPGGGGGGAWAPGNFGFLQAPAGSGGGQCTGAPGSASFMRCLFALNDPNTRCVRGRVNTAPGQKTAVHAGMNVRFDIYDSPLPTNNQGMLPAKNVTKGKVYSPANACTSNKLEDPPALADTDALPRDRCFATDTCAGGTGADNPRFGNGITDTERADYWAKNHNGAGLPAALQGATRYAMYRYEIDNNVIPNLSAQGGENGNTAAAPRCGPGFYDNVERDRRMLTVAVLNCIEHGVSGSSTNVPVESYARMFLTEPIGYETASSGDVFAEVVGIAAPDDQSGIVRTYPVLYR